MSTPPIPYNRQASFMGFSTEQHPAIGQDLEAEFGAIRQCLEQTQDRLAQILRDDGLLASLSVHPDAPSQAVRPMPGAEAGTPKGNWRSGLVYNPKDIVRVGATRYLAVVEHVTGADFNADLAAGKWLPLSASGDDDTLRIDLADAGKGAALVQYDADETVKQRLDALGNLRADLASPSNGGMLIGFQQAGAGAVARTARDKLREFVSVKDFGALGNGVADDTNAINAAITYVGTAGGGTVFLPAGTYLVKFQGTALIGDDREIAINIQYNNVHLLGAGRGCTLIKQMTGAIRAHVIKIGRRVDIPNPVSDCSIRSMTIDGNKNTLTSPKPTPDERNGNCIDVSTGASRVTLEDLHIKNAGHYGIGMQRNTFTDCRIRNCLITDTNGDGIDWKIDTNSSSRNNTVENVTVLRFGLDRDYAARMGSQAGIDVRNGVSVLHCYCGEYQDDSTGVRVQIGVNDLATTVPVQRSVVEDVTCIASAIGTATIGVQLGVNGVKVNGAHCSGNKWNYRVRSSLNTVENISSAGGEIGIWVFGDANAKPDNNVFSNMIVRSATSYGVLVSGIAGFAPANNTFVNVISASNASDTHNFEIAAAVTGTRLIGGSVAAGYVDAGTDTVTSGVQGLVTSLRAGREIGQHVLISGDASTNSITGISKPGLAKPMAVMADAESGDLWLRALNATAGSRVRFGTYTANADAPIVGYISIKDDSGTIRKLAVIS